MIDISIIRRNPELVEKSSKSKNIKISVQSIVKTDAENRKYITQIDKLRAELRSLSKAKPDADTIKKLRLLSDEIRNLENKQKIIDEKLKKLLYEIPAIPRPDVKIGKDEKDNETIKVVGNPRIFDNQMKDYMSLAEMHDLIDTKRAAKVSGTRFGYIKNELALLEVALMQYTLDLLAQKERFVPFFPPVFVSETAMNAMGYIQHGGEDETYHFEKDKLYLVGTSEQSLGPYHMDEILDESKLPLRYCAFSTCFRREAGAAGKDTTGILRVHQFDKIEMFIFCKPEDSDKEHEYLLGLEERLVAGLELPYRIVKMCTGDLGMPASRKYDIECWLPSQNTYRETHSTSNCVDFQSRRLNIRYKNSLAKKNEFVHTLNGTAFAIGRILIMILENYQNADGSINVPKQLQSYMHGIKVIK